jgi:hypothetical protein
MRNCAHVCTCTVQPPPSSPRRNTPPPVFLNSPNVWHENMLDQRIEFRPIVANPFRNNISLVISWRVQPCLAGSYVTRPPPHARRIRAENAVKNESSYRAIMISSDVSPRHFEESTHPHIDTALHTVRVLRQQRNSTKMSSQISSGSISSYMKSFENLEAGMIVSVRCCAPHDGFEKDKNDRKVHYAVLKPRPVLVLKVIGDQAICL